MEIDVRAKEKVLEDFGLPPCLHMPIAARDEESISRFIGKISDVLVPGTPNKALLVSLYEIPKINPKLPIWQIKESVVFHYSKQVWVHVDYSGYRKAFIRAFPDEDLTGLVLDHIMNRRVARLKGFNYLRIVPISRGANSSSGGQAERLGVEYHSTPRMREKNKMYPDFIQYADLADLVKMLDLKTGGSFQEGVRDAIKLIEEF